MRRLLKILLWVVAVFAAVGVWLYWPVSATKEVEGIGPAAGTYDVTILRDTYGVPHIRGHSDADAAYGLAWAHAEDDFVTIQQTLLAARGKLASVYGADSAPVDYFVHLLRIWDTVDAGWPTISPEARAVADAYADGLNHYAATHPDEALVGLFPVEGKDIVAAFTQKVPLFFGLDGTLAGLFEDERPDVSVQAAPSVRYGSNVFAVSPRRSSEGETLFASNSHQPWTGPVAWYEAHVTSDEGWDMSGALFPAMPVLALGHNRNLAWSMTVNAPDLIDVYLLDVDPDDPNRYRVDGEWLTFEVRDAPIEVKLAGRLHWTFHREALWSIYGPVVRRPHGTYAIRYAGMGQVGMLEQLYRMNKAATFDEWRDALAAQDGLPSFNIGYGDRTGTIAYVYHGLIPQRDPAYDWQGYVPGDTSRTLWTDYVKLDDLPWVIDPKGGYIQNANSSPFTAAAPPDTPEPAAFPGWMGVETQETNRSLRLQSLLGADDEIDFDEFTAIKFDLAYDARSLPARLRDRIVAADYDGDEQLRAAVDVVAGWDLTTDLDDPATALMIVTLANIDRSGADVDVSKLVEGTVTDAELESAFRSAVRSIFETYDRVDPPWGTVNRLVRGDVDLPLDGGPDVVRATYGDLIDWRFEGVAGDSYVLLLDWHPDGSLDAWSVQPFGSATSRPGSPHYADQAPLFAGHRLKPAWFDETDIRAHLEREYRPGG